MSFKVFDFMFLVDYNKKCLVGGVCMNKLITFIVPYAIIVSSYLTTLVDWSIKSEVLAIVVGCLISLWYICMHKTTGDRSTMTLLSLTLVLLIVGDILTALFYLNMLAVFIFTTVLHCFVLYSVSQNKPRYSYTYSYKDKKRRYF